METLNSAIDTFMTVADSMPINGTTADSLQGMASSTISKYHCLGSPPADWFQGFGGIAAVLTLWYLIWKDNKKQKQINDLANIAEKLESQSQAMIEGNSILNEQVGILRDSMLTAQENQQLKQQMTERDERRHKAENRPRFSRKLALNQSGRDSHFQLKNNGKLALNVEIHEIGEQKTNMGRKKIGEIGEGKERRVLFQFKDPNYRQNRYKVPFLAEFDLTFEDVPGTKYKQSLTLKGDGGELGEVEEIKPEQQNPDN